jgi:phosphate uptake regulator
MVALPKRWVKEMGLRQGSEIIVTRPSLSSLLITADLAAPVSDKKEALVEVSERDNPDTVFRKVVSLYILGYSQISLRGGNGFLSSGRRDAVKDLVRRHLIGTEGVADSKDRITVHVLLGYSELSVDNALKKMLLITSAMQKDSISALQQGEKVLAGGVVERDDEVGRFGLYVIRQLNMSINQGISKESILEPRDLLGYTQVARSLERIAHHASSMARVALELDEAPPKPFLQKLAAVSGEVSGLVDDAMLSLFKRDHAGADQVVERAKRFTEMESAMMRSLDEKDIRWYYAMHILSDSQRRMVEYARDIAEVVLDLTIERVVKRGDPVYARA